MSIDSISETTTTDASSLAEDIDALLELREEVARLERLARLLRTRICEAMSRDRLETAMSVEGRWVSVVPTLRYRADRKMACRLLAPEIVDKIFVPVRSVILREK